jgi:hypothetical protein
MKKGGESSVMIEFCSTKFYNTGYGRELSRFRFHMVEIWYSSSYVTNQTAAKTRFENFYYYYYFLRRGEL